MMFNLGNLIATKNVYLNMQESSCFAYDVKNCFEQFKNKKWGDLSEEDWKLNDLAIKNNDDRILAVYNTCRGRIYIITEEDRSVTTILFTDEY